MTVQIDLWTDIVCPWCFIGVERLDKVVAEMGADVEIRHHPFQLDPTTPPEGRNIREWLKQKYGRDPTPMFATVEAAAKESGVDLVLSRQPMSYPTLAAHTLVGHAKTPAQGHAIARALFRANFVDGKNITDTATLAAIAEPHGLSADEVAALLSDAKAIDETRTEVNESRKLGIQGVPFFLFDEELAVSGAQPESVLRQAIERASASK